ncbi:hypothetical protein O983_25725 [Mycobacterium avium 09-5983]|nr:hypothetical protein O983_25725 [Mycobacterium avium 09-5983]
MLVDSHGKPERAGEQLQPVRDLSRSGVVNWAGVNGPAEQQFSLVLML